jgi:hypothetical protein
MRRTAGPFHDGRQSRAAQHERDATIDQFLTCSEATIREGFGEAYYRPSDDYISLPSFAVFKNAAHFYATAFHELGRRDACKRLRLAIGQSNVRLIDWDGNTITGELIEGTFPDYERVIPRGDPKNGWATITREPFMRAVAAATEFGNASGRKWPVAPILRFAFAGDKLTISTAFEDATSVAIGSASVTVKIAAAVMPEPREIGFYGPQIVDILRSLRGRLVRFDFYDVGGPNNFSGDSADGNAIHVIMPCRI